MKEQKKDPYIRSKSEIFAKIGRPIPGLSDIDWIRQHGGKSHQNEREAGVKSKYSVLPRIDDDIIDQGVACGRCSDGMVRPIQVWHDGQKFDGFADRNLDQGKISLVESGAAFLRVDGRVVRGMKVFCTGPVSFTVDENSDGHFIGKVRFLQPDKSGICSVAFSGRNPEDVNLAVPGM